MPALTSSEKRTIRYGAVGLAIYLTLFGGVKAYTWLAQQRADYQRWAATGRQLREAMSPLADHAALAAKLMDEFHFDPVKFNRNSLVADASAALQKAAQGGGLQPGPVREVSARGSNKELASIQMETQGQVASVMGFLQQIPSLGYPLVVDSVQLSADPMQGGMMKLTVTIMVLDFDQWKTQEANHA